MIATLSSPCEQDVIDSPVGVTREWIQSLPAELKDEALYRLCKTIEAKPTLVESFTLNQVFYRTISGGTFTESADNVAARTGCDRKTILKGLEQAYNQNILDKNVRPGTSTEYFFKPESEWKPEPVRVVRKTGIRTKPSAEFPTILEETQDSTTIQFDSVETEPVRDTDYLETDEKSARQNLLSAELRANNNAEPTSIWRCLPDGNRFAQIPPIHDQATGVEIQRQMHEEGLTAQKVVSRAVAFSKVPLMLLETLGAIGSKLVEGLSKVELGSHGASVHPTESSVPITVVATPTVSVTKTFDTSVELEDIDIDELTDVMTQIKLQLRIPIGVGMKDSVKRNWKGCTHFNHALEWCAETAEWLERQNKLEKEKLFGMLINAMKQDKKPKAVASSPEKLQNASAYSNTPVSFVQSYFELIEVALSSDDGDFIRSATLKILPLCYENKQFFGFDFVKRCFDAVSKNPKSMLVNSVHSMVKRFGHEWGVTIDVDGQVVAA